MKHTTKNGKLFLDLQFFADGTGGAEGAATAESAPVAAEQQGVNGVSPTQQEQTPDLDAEFEQLIKGKFKDQYGKRVKGAIDNRFKSQDAELSKLREFRDAAANAYGMASSNDVDAITAKMREQAEKALEDRAYQAGRSKEDQQYWEERERKIAYYEAKEQKEADQRTVDGWKAQAEELKKTFPTFDLDSESMTNDRFAYLISHGSTVGEAYMGTHPELVQNAMRYGAEQAAQSFAANVRSNMARPDEIGSSAQAAAGTRVDPSKFTREQINDLISRSLKGEKVTFS